MWVPTSHFETICQCLLLIKAGWLSAQLQENTLKTSALKMSHIGRIGKERFHIARIGKEHVHGPWLYIKGEYRATQKQS